MNVFCKKIFVNNTSKKTYKQIREDFVIYVMLFISSMNAFLRYFTGKSISLLPSLGLFKSFNSGFEMSHLSYDHKFAVWSGTELFSTLFFKDRNICTDYETARQYQLSHIIESNNHRISSGQRSQSG